MVGLTLRLVVAPLGGHPHDIQVLTSWANAAQQGGMLAVYATSSANYPPLGVWLVGASGTLYSFLTGLPPSASNGLWLLSLKLPAIFADILIAFVLAKKATRPWLVTALVIFNPAFIFLSAWWGQLESVWALFVLLALLSLDQPWLAGASLALGLLIKQQAAVAIPIFVLIALAKLWGRQPIWCVKTGLGVLLVVVLAIVPYAWTGQLALLGQRLFALVAAPGWLTINAHNLWYLVTLGQGNWQFNEPLLLPDTTHIVAGFTYRQLGLLLMLLWSLCICILTCHRRNWMLGGVLLYAGVFLLPTQVHERYLFGALVLTLGWLAQNAYQLENNGQATWQVLAFFGMITLLHSINLTWAFPLGPHAGNVMVGLLVAFGFVLWSLWGLTLLVQDMTRNTHGRPRPTSN